MAKPTQGVALTYCWETNEWIKVDPTNVPRPKSWPRDDLNSYSDLLVQGHNRKQLWTDFPDKLWGRDPRRSHFFPNAWERRAGEQQSSWRKIRFFGHAAEARFHFDASIAELQRVTVTIDPIFCPNQNSDVDKVLWRNFKAELAGDLKFVRRKEREDYLEVAWMFGDCPLMARVGRTDAEIQFKAELKRPSEVPAQPSWESFFVYYD